MAWQPTVWRRSSTRPVWTYVTSQSINLSSLICRCLPGSRNTERALMLSVHCCWCCNTGTADVSWLVVGCVVVMDQVATQCRFGCLQLIYIMLDGDQIQATFNRSSLQSRLFSLQKSLTRLGSVSANLHQHQNFSRKWSGIWIAKLIQICLISPKMLWTNYLVSVSYFARCRENQPVTMRNASNWQHKGKWKRDPESVSATGAQQEVNQFCRLVDPIITASFNEIGSLLFQWSAHRLTDRQTERTIT